MTWKVKYLSFLGDFTRRTERMISKLSQNFFMIPSLSYFCDSLVILLFNSAISRYLKNLNS